MSNKNLIFFLFKHSIGGGQQHKNMGKILQFFQHTDTDTYSVFFRLNTDTDTLGIEIHSGY